mmetsp:Transcript_16509/g.15817  ORF Transcript_16509/g.15817 Transcript_16509/m.15817 type:complete len:146 (+) Transcript_16509:508-945(+)
MYQILIKGTKTESLVFTGDCFFYGGAGQFFEGTAQNFADIKKDVIDKLPKDTHLFYGHEYAYSNLRFCHSLDPNNQFINEQYLIVKKNRALRKPNLPGTLSDEYQINVFFRFDEPGFKEMLQFDDEIQCLASLRTQKNAFTPKDN